MPVNLQIRTAYLDEKAAACHAIGVLAEHTGAPFLQYPMTFIFTFQFHRTSDAIVQRTHFVFPRRRSSLRVGLLST